MAIGNLVLQVPKMSPDRFTVAYGAEEKGPREAQLFDKSFAGKRFHSFEIVSLNQGRVKTNPFINKPRRLETNLDGNFFKCFARVIAMMFGNNRRVQVNNEVFLKWDD